MRQPPRIVQGLFARRAQQPRNKGAASRPPGYGRLREEWWRRRAQRALLGPHQRIFRRSQAWAPQRGAQATPLGVANLRVFVHVRGEAGRVTLRSGRVGGDGVGGVAHAIMSTTPCGATGPIGGERWCACECVDVSMRGNGPNRCKNGGVRVNVPTTPCGATGPFGDQRWSECDCRDLEDRRTAAEKYCTRRAKHSVAKGNGLYAKNSFVRGKVQLARSKGAIKAAAKGCCEFGRQINGCRMRARRSSAPH